MAIPFGKPFIRYLNGNNSDNRIENVEWTDSVENSEAHQYDAQTQRTLLAVSRIADSAERDKAWWAIVLEADRERASSPPE